MAGRVLAPVGKRREVAKMVTVQGRRNYHTVEKGGWFPQGWKKIDTNGEREREKRWGGLGDCVRERGRAKWRVQTRSGHGTSCCASVDRTKLHHLCYTPCQLWRINTYTRITRKYEICTGRLKTRTVRSCGGCVNFFRIAGHDLPFVFP